MYRTQMLMSVQLTTEAVTGEPSATTLSVVSRVHASQDSPEMDSIVTV